MKKRVGFFAIALLIMCMMPAVLFAGGQKEAEEEGNFKIGYVVKSLDQEFWLAVEKGAKDADAEFDNVEVFLDGATSETQVEEQIALVEDMITRGANALVVAPTAPAQLLPVLESAVADGIPVLLVDTDIDDWDGKTTFIGTDNIAAGEIAGKYVIEQLSEGSEVALLEGIPGVTTSVHRIKGFTDGLNSSGKDIEIVEQLTAKWDRAEAVSVTEDILTAHGEVDAILAANDQMALGAVEAVRAAGIDFEDILIVGFDGNPGAAQSILDGEMDASVAQMPYQMGYKGVEAARDLLMGKEISRRIDTGAELVTEENAEKFLD